MADATVSPSTFAAWVAAVHAAGGVAVVWPFKTGQYADSYGDPAARYSAADYAIGVADGRISATDPDQATANGAYVYVLASGAVAVAAPQQMSALQRLENAAFTTADAAAQSLGLPSLAGLETAINLALLAIAVFGAMWVLKHVRGWRTVAGGE